MNQYQQYFETFPSQLALDMSFDRLDSMVQESMLNNEMRFFHWREYELWRPMDKRLYDLVVLGCPDVGKYYPFIKIKS
jgi:hypothetical protein